MDVPTFEALRAQGTDATTAAEMARDGDAHLDTGWLRAERAGGDSWAAAVLDALVSLGICHPSRAEV